MRVLVTGAAGFIGFHVARGAAARAATRSPASTSSTTTTTRGSRRRGSPSSTAPPPRPARDWRFHRADLADRRGGRGRLRRGRTAAVRPGDPPRRPGRACATAWRTRSPTSSPTSLGFTHILEACRARRDAAPHLRLDLERLRRQHHDALRRGAGRRPPAAVLRRDQAGERADGACLRHLYRLPDTGLRFFTVYGPWGRPDMAPMLFASAIAEGRPIRLFNEGRHSRDFTYVDDIVEGVIRASDRPARPTPTGIPRTPTPPPRTRPSASTTSATARPVELADFIAALERALGQPGDPRAPAAAARRRARHLRRQRPPRPRGELAPGAPRSPRACAASSPGSRPGGRRKKRPRPETPAREPASATVSRGSAGGEPVARQRQRLLLGETAASARDGRACRTSSSG